MTHGPRRWEKIKRHNSATVGRTFWPYRVEQRPEGQYSTVQPYRVEQRPEGRHSSDRNEGREMTEGRVE